jgi:predicted CopG family antitoxin
MTQKTISLPDEVYNDLKGEKREDESFAQEIERLLGRKKKAKNIHKLAGIWKESADEWDQIEKGIYEDRIQGTVERQF